MPNRTYITKEEKSMPEHKPMKDWITIFVCGNASGDWKIKLMEICHKENNVMKSKLPAMWQC